MTRATYARVLVRLGSSYPTHWDATAIAALCPTADYLIDSYTAPRTISTTDDIAIEIAVDVVMRLMRIADMMHEQGGTSAQEGRQFPDFEALTPEIKERIDNLVSKGSNYGVAVVDMIGE